MNVWESRQKRLTLKQPLYGHMEAVTCLASCQGYNMVVSGSRDKTCIIWDLSRLQFVRQLRGHSGPVAALCVNELTVSLLMHYLYNIYMYSIECYTRSLHINVLRSEVDSLIQSPVLTSFSGLFELWFYNHVMLLCDRGTLLPAPVPTCICGPSMGRRSPV